MGGFRPLSPKKAKAGALAHFDKAVSTNHSGKTLAKAEHWELMLLHSPVDCRYNLALGNVRSGGYRK
jgi:hypothetical protein